MSAPVAVALDVPTLEQAVSLAGEVDGIVSHCKVGLESYLRDGATGIAAIRAAAPATRLFLDMKFHDIPNTMAGAARSVAVLRPDILTVHAAAGQAGIAAVCEALPDTRVAAVTVLTSLSATDTAGLGISGTPAQIAVRWAELAVAAGARAIVCSAQEVGLIRQRVPADIVLITPGIRPAGTSAGDQSRVVTPADAIAAGSDLLVVGRPITAADSPGTAARDIADQVIKARRALH